MARLALATIGSESRARWVAGAILSVSGSFAAAGAERGPWFEEVSQSWGVLFEHRHGGRGDFYMPETMGSGVVVFDYDTDGDDDLFFVDSGDPAVYRAVTDPPWRGARSRLLRNDLTSAGPRFVDVTQFADIRFDGYGMGAVAGDVDGDGDPDLVVTTFGPTQLLRNDGKGGFSLERIDDDEEALSWGASAGLADADQDGDLDLYVTHYVDFDYDNNHLCGEPARGLRSYCHPNEYRGLADRFYVNDGAGRFRDATKEFGFDAPAARGNGLGVVWYDSGRDSWPDLYVANDMTANALFHNRGASGEGAAFEEVAALWGAALSDRGAAEAGMGIAVGDWDGNGREDLLVTHLDRQTNALYSAHGDALFLDQRFAAAVAEPSVPRVGFGAAFEDFDLDGDLDLVVANGHIIHNVEDYERGTTFRQPNDLFELRDRRYVVVRDSGLDVVRSSRGLATGDLDLDGWRDVVVSNSNEAAEVYRNRLGEEATSALPALRVRLRAGSEAGPICSEAIGSWLSLVEETAESGVQEKQVRYTRTASSYLSQSSLEQYLALAEPAPQAARWLHIQWPDGAVQRIRLRALDVGRRWMVQR